jgi:signal transduction histidine kinase
MNLWYTGHLVTESQRPLPRAAERRRPTELERRRREVAALCEVARTVNQTLDPGAVVQAAVEAINAALAADGALIRTLDPSSGRLTLASATGLSAPVAEDFRVLEFGKGLSGHVLLSNAPLVVEDARGDRRLSGGIAAREGLRSLAVVPIHARTGLIGTVAIFTRAPRRFRADELALLQSIADQVGVALENARLYEAEHRRVADLERLNQLKTDFAATVSHELRTPMTVVKTSFDALLRDWERLDNARRLEYLRVGRAGADRLRRLLENLLLVSGIEDNRIQLRLEPVALAPVVDQVVGELRERQECAIRSSLPPDLPMVRADRSRLGDVIASLLENAIRYSAVRSPVTVSAEWRNSQVVVSVADHGIGIAPEDMPRLFKRFERIDRTVRSHTGTGLGLYISRRLVEVMGGRIWAESELGAGSTFHVQLAAEIPPEGRA